MIYVASIVVGYLLGSISFAYLICQAKGVDIFSVGSGNPGATNVTRVLGGKWGKICFTADLLKGFLATLWPLLLVDQVPQPCDILRGPGCAVATAAGSKELYAIIGCCAAIAGHTTSLHLKWITGRFRGGKAVATTMGGLLALSWPVLLCGLVVWALVYFLMGRIVGLASVVFAASLPVFGIVWAEPPVVFWFLAFLGAFIIYKHRENLSRLVKGQERAFSTPESSEASDAPTQPNPPQDDVDSKQS